MAVRGEELKRSLSNRQIQMLAIGGVIGVGLFYGASVSVKLAGPGVLLDFIICGALVSIVMRALGEMTVDSPVAGSFSYFAARYLGPRIGFITAGMWWFYWVTTVMSELAAVGKLVEYWFPAFPAWVPGLIALILFTASNLLAVGVFGEVEYWFAFLKILAVAVFMVFGGLIIFFGFHNGGQAVGVANLWSHGGFLPNGWLGVMMAMSLVVQAYSGIETLGVESAESKNPKVTMRRSFRIVTVRILVIYVGSMAIMLSAYPWNYLVHHGGSPYVLLFARVGIPLAASLVNIVIILSGLSSCNTGLYGGSRMLYGLASDGLVSRKMGLLNRNKVPNRAVWLTALAISIGIVVTYLAPNNVYVWITSASAFASLWTWGIILVSELLFRSDRRRKEQSVEFAVPLWPYLPIAGLVLLAAMLVGFVLSPLTRVSVWAGIIFLVALAVYTRFVDWSRRSEDVSEWAINRQ